MNTRPVATADMIPDTAIPSFLPYNVGLDFEEETRPWNVTQHICGRVSGIPNGMRLRITRTTRR